MRIKMMPRDIDDHGKVSGGVILCYVDLAAAVVARTGCANSRINRMVTRAMSKVEFKQPVYVSDWLTCWGTVVARGTTSVTVKVEVEVDRKGKILPVTQCETAVFVALDADGKPTPICSDAKQAKRKRRKPAPPVVQEPVQPIGERQLALRKMMMPSETNPMGNIFGGLLLTYMDQAGAYAAERVCANAVMERCATRLMDKVEFKQPVHIGDWLSCWATVTKIGNTSVHVHVEAEADRKGEIIPVTQADLVFVAMDGKSNKVSLACGSGAGKAPAQPKRTPSAKKTGCAGRCSCKKTICNCG